MLTERYQNLLSRYEDGMLNDYDIASLPDPEDVSSSFLREALRVEDGIDEIDRRVIREYLTRIAEHDRPFTALDTVDTSLNSIASYCIVKRSGRFRDLIVEFLDGLEEHHGRGTALTAGIQYSCGLGDDVLLDHTIDSYSHDDESTRREELYAALCYRRLDDQPLDEAEPFTDAGEAVQKQYEQNEILIDSNQQCPLWIEVGKKYGDLYRLCKALFVEVNWRDSERARLIREPKFNAPTTNRHYLPDEFFYVMALHNLTQEEFRTGPDAPDQARDIGRTLQALRDVRDWADEPDEELFDEAIDGLSTGGYDKLKPLFRTGDVAGLEAYAEAGGDFRAYELYRAARLSPGNEEPAAFVAQHYEPDTDKLRRALKAAIQGIAKTGLDDVSDPLASTKWLIEQGAHPETTAPSLFEIYIYKLYKNGQASPAHIEVAESIRQLSDSPDREALRQYYEPDNVPAATESLGAPAYDPLLTLDILPTQEQLQSLRNAKPLLTERLIERMPKRARQSADFLTRQKQRPN